MLREQLDQLVLRVQVVLVDKTLLVLRGLLELERLVLLVLMVLKARKDIRGLWLLEDLRDLLVQLARVALGE